VEVKFSWKQFSFYKSSSGLEELAINSHLVNNAGGINLRWARTSRPLIREVHEDGQS
jgi:hypothetical protein